MMWIVFFWFPCFHCSFSSSYSTYRFSLEDCNTQSKTHSFNAFPTNCVNGFQCMFLGDKIPRAAKKPPQRCVKRAIKLGFRLVEYTKLNILSASGRCFWGWWIEKFMEVFSNLSYVLEPVSATNLFLLSLPYTFFKMFHWFFFYQQSGKVTLLMGFETNKNCWTSDRSYSPK